MGHLWCGCLETWLGDGRGCHLASTSPLVAICDVAEPHAHCRANGGSGQGASRGALPRGCTCHLPPPVVNSLCSGAKLIALEVMKGTGLSKEVRVGGALATSGSMVSSTDVEPGAIWRVHLLGARLVNTAVVLCLLI